MKNTKYAFQLMNDEFDDEILSNYEKIVSFFNKMYLFNAEKFVYLQKNFDELNLIQFNFFFNTI